MTTAAENKGFKSTLSRFFRTEIKSPFKFARVLVGGTLGLTLFIAGAPAMVYAAYVTMAYLDWFFNAFIIAFTLAHFSFVYRDRIKSALRTMGEDPKAEAKPRIEPVVTQNKEA
jgi:hypothetical protein